MIADVFGKLYRFCIAFACLCIFLMGLIVNNENILTFKDLAWKIDYRLPYIKYEGVRHI